MADARHGGFFCRDRGGDFYGAALFSLVLSGVPDPILSCPDGDRGIYTDRDFYPVRSSDLPDEGYPEDVYVSWGRA